jgi:antitoxin (DNA-binding transcriptional repressor) of toxin-antitoxin stability system
MARKSDPTAKRLSATEASRSFSRLLDEVEKGRRFLIHRHGEDVCVMAPPPLHGRLASECLALLRARSPVTLDEGFSADLLEVIAGEVIEVRSPWDS